MALLLDNSTARSGAPAAEAPAPLRDGHRLDFAELLERWHLDPTEFQVRRHALCDCSGFADGSALVTVTNRRARASRTYVTRLHPDEWTREFEQDLRAGVFSSSPQQPR